MLLLAVLAGTGAGLFYLLKDADHSAVATAATASVLILTNLYGMAVLVVLLAHGLIKLPIFLWKYSDVNYMLIAALSRADRVRRAYRTALIEYHEQISICKSLEAQHADGYNRKFFDVLMSEIPEHDLEGQKIGQLKSIGGLELKKGKTVDEDLIAQVRYKHKLAFYQYQRKRARWQELFLHIDKLVKKPITYNKEDIGKNVSQVNLAELKATDRVDEDKLALKPIEMKRKWAVFFKALAFLSFIWALVVLATETTLIFGPQYTLVNFFVEQNS